VLDVVDDAASGEGPRILVRVSGPAVDATGIGPGFSGSPIYCPDAQGAPRSIGAISEEVGEYGGKVALATPIEAILGTPVDPPRPRARSPRALARARRALAGARPLAAPLTVTGLSTRLGGALQRAAARRGRMLLAAPAGPLGSFPVQTLRPGAAFGVGYAWGDIGIGGIGTVTYTDGDRVWGFGHPLNGFGARALALQDAYVFRVINNPTAIYQIADTYKYAAAGHVVGTLSNDALDAVAGRAGVLPPAVPVRVFAGDLDTGAKRTVAASMADESDVGQPFGASIAALAAPLAVVQAVERLLGGSPARLTGEGCFRITLREAKQPMRFCNRYVTDQPDETGAGTVLAATAGSDLSSALGLIDGYKAGPAHVTGIETRLQIRRGQAQAFLRGVRLPRRARAGQRVRATLALQHVRGALERRRVRLRLPRDLRPGRRRVVFTGTDVDGSGGDLFAELFDLFGSGPSGGDPGPPNLRRLRKAVEGTARYDGISARAPSSDPDDLDPGEPAYRARDMRISGHATARIRIRKR
jgi:hypothetical protein